ncbi:major capsid protein [Escherichia coli]|uniref:major capsid protein n=1 Tax=Escherichia coli TaxID=562 RepID=UPI001F0D798C|nr:major capsid protein [Escherichia coli]UMR99571.1 capsid protein [Escherichia coli]
MSRHFDYSVYDTAFLVQVVPNLMVAQNWLLNNFFPNIVLSDTESVAIDVEIGKRRMSPFCSPKAQGKTVEARPYQTNTFKPPYIKDKRIPDINRPVRRMIGERIGGGDYTPAQRWALNLQYEMADQIDMLNRRLEWVAAQALQYGKVTVSGEGFNTTEIDFQRDDELTIALTEENNWLSMPSQTTPTDNLEEWATMMLKKTGATPTEVIFTPSAWDAFMMDARIQSNAMNMPLLNPFTNVVNPGTQVVTGAVYKGRWGNFSLWLYNDWFIDPDDDVEKPMLEDGSVILTGPALSGTRAFGCIIDPMFSYGPMAFAPKIWYENDPAVNYLMMQSSPLVIPSRVNAAMCVKVV